MCPKTVEEWVSLGKSLLARANYEEAAKAFEHGLQLDKQDMTPWKLLARVYNEVGATQDAVDALRKALEVAPGDAELWNNLAVALDDLGELAEAMDAHERSLALDPTDAVAWYNTGLAFVEVNLLGNALFCFDRARELGEEDGLKKAVELPVRGIQAVEPSFAARIAAKTQPSARDAGSLVCEKCGATLPRAPTKGRDVPCPGCGWVWRGTDFQ